MSEKTIDRLTDEQIKRLGEHFKEWFEIGVRTGRADRENAERNITEMYKLNGYDPVPFFWFESPLAVVRAINILNREEKEGVNVVERAKELEKLSMAELEELSNFKDEKPVITTSWGQLDVYWVAFYLFCQEIGVEYDPKDKALLHHWAEVVKSTFWWWSFQELCLCSERPTYIHLNEDKTEVMRHNPDGDLCTFSDGWGVCMLNGVHVPRELVYTPADQLDPAMVIKEPNAQVRAEIVKKIGLPRIMEELGCEVIEEKTVKGLTRDEINQVIADFYMESYASCGSIPAPEVVDQLVAQCEMDQQDRPYRLINLNIGDRKVGPYLHMKNPSTGEELIEGVDPSCQTLEEAFRWRNGGDYKIMALT